MRERLGARHYIWGFFLIWVVVSSIVSFALGGFESPDCSLPINSQEYECLPDEEVDQPTGGYDPNFTGEFYDGGDYPAP